MGKDEEKQIINRKTNTFTRYFQTVMHSLKIKLGHWSRGNFNLGDRGKNSDNMIFEQEHNCICKRKEKTNTVKVKKNEIYFFKVWRNGTLNKKMNEK